MNPRLSAEMGLAAELRTPFPGACLAGKFQLRNPFRVHNLTWQCRQHLLLHHQHAGSGLRALLRRWLQHKVYRAARSLTFLPQGKASLLIGSEWRDFSFNPANTQFESIYAPTFRNGYEPETAMLIDALLPPDGVMMDIGANWGHVSLFAASRPGFRGQIHAFEPMPPTYADLVASVHGTGMEKVVTTHNVALANQEGTSSMILPDGEQSGLASLRDNAGSPVRVTRLDLLGLPAPDLMKIDVEGHEADVLRGAQQTIRQNRPMIIFESGLGRDIPAALEPFHVLEEQDYRFFLPAFVRDDGTGKCFTSYGLNGDLNGSVCLALVPFASQGRWLLQPHANIFACHAERLMELAAGFNYMTGEEVVHVPNG